MPQFFSTMESLENSNKISEIIYSFYENDSSDDTASEIIKWLKSRNYIFKSERRGWNRFNGKDKRRTQLLARARNTSLMNLMQAKLDYILIVDVDIPIETDHCIGLLQALEDNPEAAMACASSLQRREAIDTGGADSYYDSWALIDRFGRATIDGLEIPFLDKNDRNNWLNQKPISVQAAFGGLALARASTIREQKALWDGSRGCEHWHFCQTLRRGGDILVIPNLNPRANSGMEGQNFHPKYANKVKQILSQESILK